MTRSPFTIVMQGAGVLAITLIANAAPAVTRSGAEILASTEPPAYRTRIGDELVLRSMMMENTRRALLVGRCSSYDRNFPKTPAPAMESAMRKAEDWALRGDLSLVDRPFASADMRRLMEAVAQNTFTQAEVDAWMAMRSSPKVKRAAAIWSMYSALGKVQEMGLRDVMTGTQWYWPLAQLRKLSDDVGLRAAFDAAVNRIQPGGAAAVARIVDSPVAVDDPRLDKVVVAAETDALAASFEQSLNAEDRVAVERLMKSPFLARWSEVAEAFATAAITDTAVKDICARARVGHCAVGSEIDMAAKALRSKWTPPGTPSYPLPVLQQMLRQIPEAGCGGK